MRSKVIQGASTAPTRPSPRSRRGEQPCVHRYAGAGCRQGFWNQIVDRLVRINPSRCKPGKASSHPTRGRGLGISLRVAKTLTFGRIVCRAEENRMLCWNWVLNIVRAMTQCLMSVCFVYLAGSKVHTLKDSRFLPCTPYSPYQDFFWFDTSAALWNISLVIGMHLLKILGRT